MQVQSCYGLTAVIPDISCDESEVQLWLSCCRASCTTGSLLPLPEADVVGMLLFPTMVCYKPCEILAKTTLVTLAIKKCLYSDLSIRLSYGPFCKHSLWSRQRYCRANGKLSVLGHCWTCSCSHFQAECKADLQWSVGLADSARPLVQGSVVPLQPLGGGALSALSSGQAHQEGVYLGAF